LTGMETGECRNAKLVSKQSSYLKSERVCNK
jgi:hypothetical protein